VEESRREGVEKPLEKVEEEGVAGVRGGVLIDEVEEREDERKNAAAGKVKAAAFGTVGHGFDRLSTLTSSNLAGSVTKILSLVSDRAGSV